MAGFQQAANALTGAIGTIGGRVGIYNELVGKNKELIKELGNKNVELEKKSEEMREKNKTIRTQYKDLENKNRELRSTNEMLNQSINQNSMMAQDYVRMSNMAGRAMEYERSIESKNKMLDIIYGPYEHKTAGPTGKYGKYY